MKIANIFDRTFQCFRKFQAQAWCAFSQPLRVFQFTLNYETNWHSHIILQLDVNAGSHARSLAWYMSLDWFVLRISYEKIMIFILSKFKFVKPADKYVLTIDDTIQIMLVQAFGLKILGFSEAFTIFIWCFSLGLSMSLTWTWAFRRQALFLVGFGLGLGSRIWNSVLLLLELPLPQYSIW